MNSTSFTNETSTGIYSSNQDTSDSPAVGPVTTYESRSVMLRAERRDEIVITEIISEHVGGELPNTYTVVQRTETYYGPELLLYSDESNYLLIAPGPDCQLMLLVDTSNDDERRSWERVAEVTAEIKDIEQYEICDQCGNPIRSLQHERLSSFGQCPG